jgi:hypothetical protein
VTHLQQQHLQHHQQQQQQQQQHHQQQHGHQGQQQQQTPAVAASSRSRGAPGSTVYAQYMLQLSEMALSLACSGSFRGQQYSNLLWCFARCRCKLPLFWMHKYLSQVSNGSAMLCCAVLWWGVLCCAVLRRYVSLSAVNHAMLNKQSTEAVRLVSIGHAAVC